MKNKYKVVALVPLEFSVEGSSDSKEAIESVKNIFEACCLFWRGFDQRGMRRLCREQHITIGEVTQHG